MKFCFAVCVLLVTTVNFTLAVKTLAELLAESGHGTPTVAEKPQMDSLRNQLEDFFEAQGKNDTNAMEKLRMLKGCPVLFLGTINLEHFKAGSNVKLIMEFLSVNRQMAGLKSSRFGLYQSPTMREYIYVEENIDALLEFAAKQFLANFVQNTGNSEMHKYLRSTKWKHYGVTYQAFRGDLTQTENAIAVGQLAVMIGLWED